MLGDPSAGRVVAAPAGLRDLLHNHVHSYVWVGNGWVPSFAGSGSVRSFLVSLSFFTNINSEL